MRLFLSVSSIPFHCHLLCFDTHSLLPLPIRIPIPLIHSFSFSTTILLSLSLSLYLPIRLLNYHFTLHPNSHLPSSPLFSNTQIHSLTPPTFPLLFNSNQTHPSPLFRFSHPNQNPQNPRNPHADPQPNRSHPIAPTLVQNTVDHNRAFFTAVKKFRFCFLGRAPFCVSIAIGMLGTGLNFGRARGEDRFYVPGKHRRSFNGVESDRLRRAHSDVTASRSSSSSSKSVDSVSGREPENRVGSEDAKKVVAVPSCEGAAKRMSNLEQFLQSITPSVPAQYLSKRTMRGFKTCDAEFQPYFVLGDLWESFREWSAYGAGVPLVLNGNDSVVQYYVPYLSGIQIYVQSPKPSVKSRLLGEDSDSDFRDSSSDGSSDCEPDRGLKYLREQRNLTHLSDDVPHQMGRLSLRDHHTVPQDGFSSDDGDSSNSQGYLLFEYLERNPPYSREPLADKILDLAFRFPELVTLRSCDILPSSWISVAWYPIYRIPTGPTLKDLDACFLTYHSLYTPVGGAQGVQPPVLSYSTESDSNPKMSLPVFGLASYKFKGSLWTPNGGYERQLASSLSQAADNWLGLLQVSHPDFMFFSR